MGFFISIVVVSVFVLLAFSYWENMDDLTEDSAFSKQIFWNWFFKGLIAPIAFWFILNSGLVPFLPLFVIDLVSAKNGNMTKAIEQVFTTSALLTSSFWTTCTFGWLVAATVARIPQGNRAEMKVRAFWRTTLLTPIAIVFLLLFGWLTLGFASLIVLVPLAHTLIPLLHLTPTPTSYAQAIGRMRYGRYDEAELAVINQLEKQEDDFDGWMLLAELYAVHFHDMDAADDTIRGLCDNKNTTLSQCGVALHALADWHLAIGKDPVAARSALEGICLKYPRSHLDRMARQRIDQLPASAEELAANSTPRVIRLPHASTTSPNSTNPGSTTMTLDEARNHAESYAYQLQQDPSDIAARDRYARILSEHLNQHDEALQQLRLLLDFSDQPDDKRARWLNQSAEIESRHRQNFEGARALLRQLICDYPQSPEAFHAQRRLNLLSIEQQLKKTD